MEQINSEQGCKRGGWETNHCLSAPTFTQNWISSLPQPLIKPPEPTACYLIPRTPRTVCLNRTHHIRRSIRSNPMSPESGWGRCNHRGARQSQARKTQSHLHKNKSRRRCSDECLQSLDTRGDALNFQWTVRHSDPRRACNFWSTVPNCITVKADFERNQKSLAPQHETEMGPSIKGLARDRHALWLENRCCFADMWRDYENSLMKRWSDWLKSSKKTAECCHQNTLTTVRETVTRQGWKRDPLDLFFTYPRDCTEDEAWLEAEAEETPDSGERTPNTTNTNKHYKEL